MTKINENDKIILLRKYLQNKPVLQKMSINKKIALKN